MYHAAKKIAKVRISSNAFRPSLRVDYITMSPNYSYARDIMQKLYCLTNWLPLTWIYDANDAIES